MALYSDADVRKSPVIDVAIAQFRSFQALRDELLVAKAADLVAESAVPVALTESEEAAAEETAEAVDPEAD